MKDLLDKYDYVFLKDNNDLGFYDKTKFEIDTGTEKPVKQKALDVTLDATSGYWQMSLKRTGRKGLFEWNNVWSDECSSLFSKSHGITFEETTGITFDQTLDYTWTIK